MIKKLQALRAKKGFTLVELIVVIAIIGVLAAILVPTMMGMVTKSRVTSVDSTAKSLADTVVTWMSEVEANGGKIPGGAGTVYTITISNTGATNSDFDAADVAKLTQRITDDYSLTANSHGTVYIKDRKVLGAVYYDSASASTAAPSNTDFDAKTFAWDGKTDGLTTDGIICGTSPKLKMAGGASSTTTTSTP